MRVRPIKRADGMCCQCLVTPTLDERDPFCGYDCEAEWIEENHDGRCGVRHE